MTHFTRRAAAAALATAALLGGTATAAVAAPHSAATTVFRGYGYLYSQAVYAADLAASSHGYNPANCMSDVEHDRYFIVTLYC